MLGSGAAACVPSPAVTAMRLAAIGIIEMARELPSAGALSSQVARGLPVAGSQLHGVLSLIMLRPPWLLDPAWPDQRGQSIDAKKYASSAA